MQILQYMMLINYYEFFMNFGYYLMLNIQTNELHDANFRIYNDIKLSWFFCEFKMAIPARREVSLGISQSNYSKFLFIIIIFHNEDKRDVQQ